MKKTVIKIRYRKITNSSLPAAQYWPIGHVDKNGREHISSTTLKLDPILRKKQNRKLARIIVKHELNEIKARVHGHKLKEAHRIAESKEPAWFNRKYRTHTQLQKALRGGI